MPRRSATIVILKTLAGATALGVLAYGAAAATRGKGLLAHAPMRMGTAVTLCGLAAVGLLLVLFRLATRRPDPDLLDPASELTTLTFPPESRNARPRVQRAK